MDSYIDKLNTALGKVQTAKRQLKFFEDQKGSLMERIKTSEKNLVVIEKSAQAIKDIMVVLAARGIEALEGLMKYALNLIFNDRDYDIKLETEDKRGVKTLDFYLLENIDGEVIKSNIDDETGGSVQTIVSIITQMFYINDQNAIPVLFIDEAFADIDKAYLDNLFSLFKLFKDKMGFDYLIISHMTDIIAYADHVYELNDGVTKQVR